MFYGYGSPGFVPCCPTGNYGDSGIGIIWIIIIIFVIFALFRGPSKSFQY